MKQLIQTISKSKTTVIALGLTLVLIPAAFFVPFNAVIPAAARLLNFPAVASANDVGRASEEEEPDVAAVAIGERLFLETRFAQFFLENSKGDANAVLAKGDPTMDFTLTASGTLFGPFMGEAMNCRACHLVDEHEATLNGSMRTYADFARRSPIPARADGRVATPRNSQPLVNAFLNSRGKNFLLHFDGEFTTVEDLIRGTLTGRNFGWLPNERERAVAHVADIIRNDDGTAYLGQLFGGRYSVVLKGTDPNIPNAFRLPKEFLLDVATASDKQIVDTVAKLMSVYLRQLMFARDRRGDFSGSPYDMFLRKNRLPTAPARGESDLAYSRRLAKMVEELKGPRYIDGTFKFHEQPFLFGPLELQGLKIFLREPMTVPPSRIALGLGGVGNCIACHPAPKFTDFGFHNTGAAQDEYDFIHGSGAFNEITVPNFATRRNNYNGFLPPTPTHPNATGMFFAIPSKTRVGYTDLGLWNVFANPDMPVPQERIRSIICEQFKSADCSNNALLSFTIASFKTPGLRDLGHSAPYMHNGRLDDLEAVITQYTKFSGFARAGTMRNADPQMKGVTLKSADSAALVAFLKSLNEDYN